MTNKYLNSNQLAAMFGVSVVTIYHWRKGTSKVTALPTAAVKYTGKAKPPVRFLPSQVAAWAKKNRIVVVDPTQAPAESAVAKPGPKPRPVTSEPAKKAAKPVAKKEATKSPAKVAAKKATKPVTKPVAKKATKVKPAPVSITHDASLEDAGATN